MQQDHIGREDVSASTVRRPLDITEAVEMIVAGELTAVELVEQSIRRSDALDGVLGSYVCRTDAAARAAAKEADDARSRGERMGPLAGIPIAVKDIITTTDAPTTAQSRIIDPAYATRGDATVVHRLRRAGAAITGKASTMEYAMGIPDDGGFPLPRNPWDVNRWTGGSSSGSANGVAAGLFLGALGTDTGGSVRIPAAWCGITGLKPTFGRVPNTGAIPLGFGQDTIGPMARTARDCALMLSVLAGDDGTDPNASEAALDDYLGALNGSVEGMRFAVDRRKATGVFDDGVFSLFDAAVEVLEAAGARVDEVALPWVEEVTAAGVLSMISDAYTIHHSELQSATMKFGRATRIGMLTGMMATSSDYLQAQRVRRVGMKAVNQLFTEYDAVLTPTCSTAAPPDFTLADSVARVNTNYWSALGNPVASVPMGFVDGGLPVGLQIAGRPFDERGVLRIADAFQRLTSHHKQIPELALGA